MISPVLYYRVKQLKCMLPLPMRELTKLFREHLRELNWYPEMVLRKPVSQLPKA